MQGQGSCSSINLPPLSLKYSSYQFSAVSLFQWLPMTPTNRPLCWRPLKSSVRFPWMNSSFAKPNLWKHFESSGNTWRIPHLFLIIQVLKNLPQQATTVHPSKQPITVSPYIVMLRICSRVAKVYVVPSSKPTHYPRESPSGCTPVPGPTIYQQFPRRGDCST